jgi:DNA invertase Pin-like site-specific DNA recombinase
MAVSKRPRRLDKSRIDGLRAGLYCRVSKAKDRGEDARANATDKSTDDQEAEGKRWAQRHRVKIAAVYADVDKSASRFARGPRAEFERMLEDVRAGKLDILWFWALNRSARNLAVFIALRDLCRECGVLIAVQEQVYDPGQFSDMLGPIIMGLVAEGESEDKSEACARGQASNAQAGLPYGPLNYGYKRLYTDGPPGRRLHESLKAQVPDGMLDESDESIAKLGWLASSFLNSSPPTDDMLAVDCPAAIVREIFHRGAAGDSDGAIAYDLNKRRIPVAREPGHGRATANPVWRDTTIATMLGNPVYAAIRVHQGQMLADVDAKWPPLVDRELFWAVQERRAANKPYRAGRGPYLLSSTARCWKCGGTLLRWKQWKQDDPLKKGHYTCPTRGCYGVSIEQEPLDRFVEDKTVLFLSDPDVFASMAQAGTSEEAARARAEAAELRVKLEENYQLYASEKISEKMADAKEKRLLADIAEADKRANEAGVPSTLLGGTIGPQAAALWVQKDVLQKREIIRTVAEITIKPIGKGRNNQYARRPISERVDWKWLIGPDAEEPTPRARNQSRFEVTKPEPVPGTVTETEDGRIILAGDFTTAEKGDVVRKLMADRGWSGSRVARAMGLSHSTIAYWMRKASGPPLRVPQREHVREFLLETELSHNAVAGKLGVASATVDRACRSLVRDGTLSECTHHLTVSGQTAPGPRTRAS